MENSGQMVFRFQTKKLNELTWMHICLGTCILECILYCECIPKLVYGFHMGLHLSVELQNYLFYWFKTSTKNKILRIQKKKYCNVYVWSKVTDTHTLPYMNKECIQRSGALGRVCFGCIEPSILARRHVTPPLGKLKRQWLIRGLISFKD